MPNKKVQIHNLSTVFNLFALFGLLTLQLLHRCIGTSIAYAIYSKIKLLFNSKK